MKDIGECEYIRICILFVVSKKDMTYDNGHK
jgi:hypothetical protein